MMTNLTVLNQESGERKGSGFYLPQLRWYICGLLFFASTINYIDLPGIGGLSISRLACEKDMHWNETDYGNIVGAFQLAYGLMMPFVGRLIDWIGMRIGYKTLAVVVWSIAAMAHSLAGNATQFGAARFCARHRRIGKLSGRDQNGGLLVPSERARPRNWHFQQRNEYRRIDCPDCGSVSRRQVRLAIRFHLHRRHWIFLE